jgi:hypothetical protein
MQERLFIYPTLQNWMVVVMLGIDTGGRSDDNILTCI